jgi:hypothetical protein
MKLGNPRNAGEAASAGRQAQAEQFAATVLPIVAALRKTGVTGYRGIAAALNGRGVRTARGGRWQVSNVRNLLIRGANGL